MKEKNLVLRQFIHFSIALAVSFLVAEICPGEESGTPPTPTMHGKLSIRGTLELNRPFTLVFTFADAQDFPEVTATIHLPESIEIVAGDTTWKGSIKENQPKEIFVTLRVKEPGEYAVRAEVGAYTDVDHNSHTGIGTDLYLDVSTDSASVSTEPPVNNWNSTHGYGSASFEKKLPADLEFDFIELPVLNKEVGLLVRVVPHENVNDADVHILLRERGLKFIRVDTVSRPTMRSEFTDSSGVDVLQAGVQYSWRGRLNKEEPFVLGIIVTCNETGSGGISASVDSRESAFTIGLTKQLFISVNKYRAIVAKEPFHDQ